MKLPAWLVQLPLVASLLLDKMRSCHKRSRRTVAFVLLIPVGIRGFLYRRGRTKSATRNDAQRNSPVHGSAKELNEYSVLKDKQMFNDGVKQEDIKS